jgi:hypothetical protein
MKGIDRIDNRLKSGKSIKMKGIVSASIALTLSIFTMEKPIDKPMGKVKFTTLELFSENKSIEEDSELKIESDAYDMIRVSL